ncbi:SGNH/GDSL hydrolase family protein [Nocardia sp. CDC160]|uniref:SGNH/GDSL hydrolase family protein n=1 Tax=Nocardia sp. CDC160 TaxID=3112166 RepID=UPI002DB7AB1C|nr:SGNH/GDSL hydrolase family protein [Nocardia sp. CDC160]MEC3916514.1 SGNH/GDSL hydrolase family protein [Nocardia sp. CDC160]
MPTAIQNLVILGDSLSDIGIKREAPAGMFARAAGMMRTNEVGRYSDGKNWTDFLVEWIGGQPLIRANKKETEDATAPHRKLTTDSLVLGTTVNALPFPVRYANYAEGGAVAADDTADKGGALGHLRAQVEKYIAARRAMQADPPPAARGLAQDQYPGPTLHIIWIGLNDLVTAARPVPDSTTEKPGTGIGPMIRDIRSLVNLIPNSLPTNPALEHFLLIDLPSPMVSVRYQDKAIDKGEASVEQVVKNVAKFNDALSYLAGHWPAPGPKDGPGANPANIGFVPMSQFMQYVSDHQQAFELTPLAQEHGPVPYLGMTDTTPRALRRALTTSDLAHPTQAVYELIARQIVDVLIPKYSVGRLNQQSWPALRPYPNA